VCRTLRHYIARDQNFKPSIFHELGFRPFTATTKNGEAFCQYDPKNYYDFETHEDMCLFFSKILTFYQQSIWSVDGTFTIIPESYH
jgi:hypothetical protein